MSSTSNQELPVVDRNDFFTIIGQKVVLTDRSEKTASDRLAAATNCVCFQTECDCEEKFLAEEKEAIAKKQLQILQADERGKQALTAEIAALKKKQEQREELLRKRQHALEIEKNRSRKIASLPPPLSRPVKLLLKQTEESTASEPKVLMPDELTATAFKPVERSYENKENFIDSEELEAKQKVQEERQTKAQMRFNEALKKNRQEMEYSAVMKEIKNAEFFNRQELAKNISSEKRSMPCPLSDKLQFSGKQADMEDAAEKVFKKCDTKEHVIEEIEGYQDQYEDKFKKIDSNFEAKMIDCIPSFIKENYDYLLEDESKFKKGKHFSDLDTSDDVLNQAYIETPPGAEELDGISNIDATISQLDRFRSEFQEQYEQTLKPLLLAAMETPKKKLMDKAVETDLASVRVEDKASETDMQFKTDLTTPSPPPVFDYNNAGVMAFKKRSHVPLGNFWGIPVPNMHKREVFYPVPSPKQPEYSTPSPLSSSSYCSLPSKHGMSTFSTYSGPAKCDICLAEMEKDCATNQSELKPKVVKNSDKAAVSIDKTVLSEYIKQIAEKYLSKRSASNLLPKEKTFSDSSLPVQRSTRSTDLTLEKRRVSKSETELVSEFQKPEETSLKTSMCSQLNEAFYESPETIERLDTIPKAVEKTRYPESDERLIEKDDISNEKFEKEHSFEDDQKVQNYETGTSPVELSDYAREARRIQAIHQVFNRRIPRFTLDYDTKSEEDKNETVQNRRMVLKPHIYHELSTIQELDSALTANSLQLSQTKLSDSSGERSDKKLSLSEKPEGDQATKGLKVASLLDPPTSQISELAKSIHFVPEKEENEDHHSKSHEAISSGHLNATPVSSKKDNALPSCTSNSDSNSLSFFSSGTKIFSSTLTGNHSKYSHPKDVKTLPSYFRDVSDIKKKASGSEKSDSCSSVTLSECFASTPTSSSSPSFTSVISTKSKENEGKLHSVVARYLGNFESPSTEKSNNNLIPNQEKKNSVVSETSKTKKPYSFIEKKITNIVSEYVPSDIKTPNVSSESVVFYPMTPHSNVSSPSGYGRSIYDNQSSSVRSFKTMTPQSYSSSPQSVISETEKPYPFIDKKVTNIVSGYVPSDIKTPNVNNESVIFYPMTPHSNVSSPSGYSKSICDNQSSSVKSFKTMTPQSNISSPSKYDNQSSSVRSFKTMTPHSNVSSPSKYDNESSSVKSFKTMTPHSNVSSPSKYDNESSSVKSFKTMTPHSNVSSPSKYDNESSSVKSFKTMTPHSNISSPSVYDNQPSSVKSFKAMTPQSNISSPESDIASVPPSPLGDLAINNPEDKHKDSDSVGRFEAMTPHTVVSSPSESNVHALNDDKVKDHSDSSGSFKTLTPKSVVSSPSLSSDEKELQRDAASKNSDSQPLMPNYETKFSQDFYDPKSNLQAISSSNSSSENLSEISGSKVVCQSTPVKNISELIKEPGILEEPDLTLVADLTVAANATQAPPVSVEDCKTPTILSPESFGTPETPSMLSFLNHEMSCMMQNDNGQSTSNDVTPSTSGNKMPQRKGAKQSPFVKSSYKERTKRLWNNLEEVKQRKAIEDKKKMMEINLIKAKEFSKKITLKQKGK